MCEMTVEAWSLWHGLFIKSGLISFPYSSLFVEGQGFPSYFAEIMQWKLFMEIFSEKEGLEFRLASGLFIVVTVDFFYNISNCTY